MPGHVIWTQPCWSQGRDYTPNLNKLLTQTCFDGKFIQRTWPAEPPGTLQRGPTSTYMCLMKYCKWPQQKSMKPALLAAYLIDKLGEFKSSHLVCAMSRTWGGGFLEKTDLGIVCLLVAEQPSNMQSELHKWEGWCICQKYAGVATKSASRSRVHPYLFFELSFFFCCHWTEWFPLSLSST